MFTEKYAELYDLFHANKNYRNEVNEIIRVLGLDRIKGLTAFDFGCGTGAHAEEFLKYGINIDGFDASLDMLKIAKKKNPSLKFSNNINDFKVNYDFTYSLFDVVSYQTTYETASDVLRKLFSKTKTGGICLIDSWNSEGVRLDPPKISERVVQSSFGSIRRRVTPDLSQSEIDKYVLNIELIESEANRVIRTETHVLRAWSPEQLSDMMISAGFEELMIYDPMNPRSNWSPNCWRFGLRAKKL